ncbi:MAG: TetR/AcrR family transcriptional regulator [Deltaproteobacteria bacterium]|nr:TetR/AcrR family transcriptional regulator [Deltaproteobacteria bacterium]
MRYPDGHKEAVREKIVRVASEALRRHGLEAVSIPALMKQAGLTHGGFYAHFKNRDELVAEAVRAAADETGGGALAPELSLAESLRRYLSMGHLEHREEGCVLAALGTDGARQRAPVRRAFAEVARGFLARIDAKLRPGRAEGARPSDAALVQASTMVGAVVLARLVDDPALAERILAAARAA